MQLILPFIAGEHMRRLDVVVVHLVVILSSPIYTTLLVSVAPSLPRLYVFITGALCALGVNGTSKSKMAWRLLTSSPAGKWKGKGKRVLLQDDGKTFSIIT